jgi:hypothetical protein
MKMQLLQAEQVRMMEQHNRIMSGQHHQQRDQCPPRVGDTMWSGGNSNVAGSAWDVKEEYLKMQRLMLQRNQLAQIIAQQQQQQLIAASLLDEGGPLPVNGIGGVGVIAASVGEYSQSKRTNSKRSPIKLKLEMVNEKQRRLEEMQNMQRMHQQMQQQQALQQQQHQQYQQMMIMMSTIQEQPMTQQLQNHDTAARNSSHRSPQLDMMSSTISLGIDAIADAIAEDASFFQRGSDVQAEESFKASNLGFSEMGMSSFLGKGGDALAQESFKLSNLEFSDMGMSSFLGKSNLEFSEMDMSNPQIMHSKSDGDDDKVVELLSSVDSMCISDPNLGVSIASLKSNHSSKSTIKSSRSSRSNDSKSSSNWLNLFKSVESIDDGQFDPWDEDDEEGEDDKEDAK